MKLSIVISEHMTKSRLNKQPGSIDGRWASFSSESVVPAEHHSWKSACAGQPGDGVGNCIAL